MVGWNRTWFDDKSARRIFVPLQGFFKALSILASPLRSWHTAAALPLGHTASSGSRIACALDIVHQHSAPVTAFCASFSRAFKTDHFLDI